MKRAACLLLIAVLLMSVAPIALSEQTVVRVGFFLMSGYHEISEDGALSGAGYDFLKLVSRYSNIKFEYTGFDMSWEESLDALRNGEIDMLTSAQKTPERENEFEFSDTLIGTSTAILTVKAGDTRFDSGDYNGIRVGLVADNSRNKMLYDFMKEKGFSYSAVFYHGMNDLTAALQEGTEIDAVMTSDLLFTEYEWTIETFDSSPYYAIVKKGNTKLMDEINSAIARMDADAAGWRTRLKYEHYAMDMGEVVAFTAAEREYLDKLRNSGRVIRAIMSPDSKPYSYFENGTAKGIVPEIFKEAALRMGLNYEIIETKTRQEYYDVCLTGDIDIILDAMDDAYTLEKNGAEISDPYYTTPIAMVTKKTNASDVHTVAIPDYSLLSEDHYAFVYSGKSTLTGKFPTLKSASESVKDDDVDASYMLYFTAEQITNADYKGEMNCLMLPGCERSFVFAVDEGESYELLSSLNKAALSLTDDAVSKIVAIATETEDGGFSPIAFVYQNSMLVICLAVAFVIAIFTIAFFAIRVNAAKRELMRGYRLERYIGYLCDLHYKVLEVDFALKYRRQYMKINGKVDIETRDDFVNFDIDSIHPDDREAIERVFDKRAIDDMRMKDVQENYIESRMRIPSGEYRWFAFTVRLIPVDNEHPNSVMLLIKDVNDMHIERERAEETLTTALAAANAASGSKSAFLSSMSHEIRTPLNAMIGYMTIAQSQINNKEKVMHCIDSAGIAARHLLSIINDVLDIASMESGKMKLSHERFDLKEQISSISTVFYQQCRQKDIKLIISVVGMTDEWVLGDTMRVNQILMNLMSNAVKFTPAGGSVLLNVTQTAKSDDKVYMRFVVKDTGIGMAKEYMDRLFTPFEQESAETGKKYGGTGLGMSITQNLVSMMGGQIAVESERGKGTAFTVTIPFGATENRDIKTAAMDYTHLRVLVVDDLEHERDYVNALLDRLNISSECAGSGEDAIKLVTKYKDTERKFDLCIIDWNMPGLDGVTTTKLIHQECDPGIPIIIATAYDIAEFEDEAISAGATRIVSKPLFQSTLMDLLMTTYGKYEPEMDAEIEIPDLTGMRVILAEDNETNVEVAVDILEMAGVVADVARNGEEAVRLFEENPDMYQAILMDVQMPVMDGYQATRVIRSMSTAKAVDIPIIALTADALAENVANALASGMTDHVAKPIETELLFSALQRAFKK